MWRIQCFLICKMGLIIKPILQGMWELNESTYLKLLELCVAESSFCRNSSSTLFLVCATSIFFLFLFSYLVVKEHCFYSLFYFADLVLKKFQVYNKTERKVRKYGAFSHSCPTFPINNTFGPDQPCSLVTTGDSTLSHQRWECTAVNTHSWY